MIAFVLGTRPEIVKLSPLIRRIPTEQRMIIWTGQHWTDSLAAEVRFDSWGDDDLPIMHLYLAESQNEGQRLGDMVQQLSSLGALFAGFKWVVVQGDTTSALAGALAGVKLGVPVYHVEAGSRSGDNTQPEELNRKLIDQAATGHAYSYHCDGENLLREGIKTFLWSGEIAIDAMVEAGVPEIAPGDSAVVTIHRAETLNNSEAVAEIGAFLRELAKTQPVVFYRHPHTAQVMTDDKLRGVDVREPVPPSEFRQAMAQASHIITDSGGAAIEASYLGIPCVVAREVTELHDLVDCGRLVIGGRNRKTLWKAMAAARRDAVLSERVQYAFAGRAAEHIAGRLLR